MIYYDGASVWGTVVGIDLVADLAILRPITRPLCRYPPVVFKSCSTLEPGEQLAALGKYRPYVCKTNWSL